MSGALVPPAPDGWMWRDGELVPVPPAPCPKLAAAAARASRAAAVAERPWQALPAAPEGWVWRAGALERVSGARRWTIGRRAAWDARWQMLVWEGGRARLVREGATVAEIVAWVDAERARRAQSEAPAG